MIEIPSEVVHLVFVAIVVIIICLVSKTIVSKADPLAKPKGFLLIAIILYQMIDNYVDALGNKKVEKLKPYIMNLCFVIFISNIWGLFGFEAPTSSFTVTLTLGIITIAMVHITRFKTKGIKGYTKTYLEPFAIMLPINILGAISPLLSISMRLFANILSGSAILAMVYWGLSNLSNFLVSNFNIAAPFVAPVLHVYFDLFSGFIQTLVFITLTTIYIAVEKE